MERSISSHKAILDYGHFLIELNYSRFLINLSLDQCFFIIKSTQRFINTVDINTIIWTVSHASVIISGNLNDTEQPVYEINTNPH